MLLGDSWSQGELTLKTDGHGHDVVHKGIEQYLLDSGHTVFNMGILGGSNTQATHCYEKFSEQADFVLWFQTDPLRDINWDYYQLFIKPLLDLKSIKAVFDAQVLFVYDRMNKIALSRSQKIHVIGGFSVVAPFINDFANLDNFIPNVSALIDPKTKFDFYGYFIQFDWFTNIIEYCRKHNLFNEDQLTDLKKEYIDMTAEHIRIIEYMNSNKQYYWPDGMHPNREGHKIIFNKVEKLIKET